MAFNIIAAIAEKIETSKATETVTVQVTDVSNRAGMVTRRVESRIFVDNGPEGYQGPTKTAIVFTTAESLDDFIKSLSEARSYLVPADRPAAKAAPKKAPRKRVAAKS